MRNDIRRYLTDDEDGHVFGSAGDEGSDDEDLRADEGISLHDS